MPRVTAISLTTKRTFQRVRTRKRTVKMQRAFGQQATHAATSTVIHQAKS